MKTPAEFISEFHDAACALARTLQLPDNPIPTKTALGEVFDLFFAASLLSDERRFTSARIAIRTKPLFFKNGEGVLIFKSDEVTPTAISKLAVATDPRFQRIILKLDSDGMSIEGIEDVILCDPKERHVSLFRHFHILNLHDFEFRIIGPGVLSATFCGLTYEFTQGKCHRPSPLFQLPMVSQSARQLLGSLKNMAILEALGSIATLIRNEGHGGGFVMVPKGIHLPTPPIEPKFHVTTHGLSSEVNRRENLERLIVRAHIDGSGPSEDGTQLANRLIADEFFFDRRLQSIARLCSVDGYLVLDPDLNVLTFGARISVQPRANDTQLAFVDSLSVVDVPQTESQSKMTAMIDAKVTRKPLNSLGLRHRAGFELADAIDSCLVFVVSQDGDLRILDREDGEVRCFTCFNPTVINTNTLSPQIE